MVITFNGASFFKVQLGDTVLAFNPISKDSKIKGTRFGADIALLSFSHPDMNGLEQVEFGEKKPFVISGPGEYEVKEIFIKGYASPSHYDGGEWVNTVYYLTLDGMKLCFLGAHDGELPNTVKEAVDDVDILFVPIGGQGTLDAGAAYKLAVSLEPKIIIPMLYGEVGEKDALKRFLKEGGKEDLKAEDKLTIKKKDIEGKEGEIVVLSASN